MQLRLAEAGGSTAGARRSPGAPGEPVPRFREEAGEKEMGQCQQLSSSLYGKAGGLSPVRQLAFRVPAVALRAAIGRKME